MISPLTLEKVLSCIISTLPNLRPNSLQGSRHETNAIAAPKPVGDESAPQINVTVPDAPIPALPRNARPGVNLSECWHMSNPLDVNAGTFRQDTFYIGMFVLTSKDFDENLGWQAKCY